MKNADILRISGKNTAVPIKNIAVVKKTTVIKIIFSMQNLLRYNLYLGNFSLKNILKLPASSSSYTT